MIRNIKLKNFKSLNSEDKLKLNKLNLLCGANSSGKSSLIQSILMLSQTFGTRFFHRSVSLNGHLVKLGGFDDIKNNKVQDENIIVSFTVDTHKVIPPHFIKTVDVEFEFGFTNNKHEAIMEQLDPPLIRSKISVQHQCYDENNQLSEIEILKSEDDPKVNNESSYTVNYMKGDYFNDLLSIYPSAKVTTCIVKGFIPDRIYVEYDQSQLMADNFVDNITSLGRRSLTKNRHQFFIQDSKIPPEFFTFLVKELDKSNLSKREKMLDNLKSHQSNLFNGLDDELLKKVDFDKLSSILMSDDNTNVTAEISAKFLTDTEFRLSDWHSFCKRLGIKKRQQLFVFIGDIKFKLATYLNNIFGDNLKTQIVNLDLLQGVNAFLNNRLASGIKYLGPLRSDPKSIYPIISSIDSKDIGVKGENAAAVLHLNKNNKFISPLPAGIESKNIPLNFKTTSVTFGKSVIEWLKYMGVVDTVSTLDKGKFGYELRVKTSNDDSLQDLTHVGVGVSQVIPIVMLCLLSEVGDTLIFEQPELHLHPKVQARLTDFLIVMSSIGRQVIVETHSEYMINRLRYRIASSEDDDVIDMSTIYFVNKVQGVSMFNDVPISQYGSIKEWPIDFFDQTQSEVESILIAASNKKKLERAKLKCKL
jgi:predicted ATPase